MQRLELTWIGKDHEPRLEPRILLENPEYRCGAPGNPARSNEGPGAESPNDDWQGMLIHGDNLLALKALEAEYSGKVKCIYIDPPYNTGSAFEHYDDGIEHSLWLSLIRDRLKILRNLLSDDGSIWISIDDNECHYLKVVCDEIFGRQCFVSNIIWRKRDGPPNDRKIGAIHEHILVYGKVKNDNSKKTLAEEKFNLSPRTEKANAEYKVFPEPNGLDPRGPFRKIDTTANGKGGRFVQSLYYPVINPYTNEELYPRQGTCWRHNKEEMERLEKERRLYWGVDGKSRTPMRKLFLSEVKDGMTAPSIWYDVALNQHASSEIEKIFGEKASFETPKPERLINLILHIATNPHDLVLDSFLGSGTTAAVAHKMGRRWIGIELGEHAYTHCVPRLQKVVRGEDQGGISKAAGWKGGGGFRVFSLAPTLLREDRFGQLVINPEYNAPMLAAAVCRHEGFRYDPDPALWWKQGRGAGRDHLLATTQHVTRPLLDAIHEDMQEGETLLICCRAFDKACAAAYPGITLRKIPNMLFSRCEWGRDDYSLHIVPQPGEEQPENEEAAAWPAPETPGPEKTNKKAALNPNQGELF